VPEDAGFDEAAALARKRGGLELAWRRGGEAEAALDRRVQELLADELTLDDAVQVALLANRRLQALYAELGFAQADLLAASRLPNPLLHAELRFPDGGGESALDLGVEQSFLGLLLLPKKTRMAEDAFAAVELRVAAGALALAGETRAAYRRLQGAEQALALKRAAHEAADVACELAQRLHAAGNLRDLDLDLERVQREEARVAVADAELAVVDAREALVRELGIYGPEAELRIAAGLPELPPPLEIGPELEGRAIERSLDLAATRLLARRAERALGLEESTRYLSELELGVAAERESGGDWTTGPSLALPLPFFSQGEADLRRAAAELERLRADYYADAVELRSRVRTGTARVLALHARASFLRDAVLPLRARILEGVQLEYNAMQEGAFRLLAAKRAELDASAAYVATLTDYWVASAGLDTLLEGAPASGALEARTATAALVPSSASPTGH